MKKGPTFQRTNLTEKRLIFIRDGMFDLKSKLSYILYKFEKKNTLKKLIHQWICMMTKIKSI